jgi:hypothetical protein
MNRSGAYDVMAREYITAPRDAPVTLKELGAKFGRSAGSVGRIAKLENWVGKRETYLAGIANGETAAVQAAFVGQLTDIQRKYLEAVEKSLDSYIGAVDSGQLVPRPSDVSGLMTTLKAMFERPRAEPNGEGNNGGITISESLGADFLRTLESVARAKLESGGMEAPPRPKLVGSSQG